MPRNFIAELGLSKGLVEKARQICSGRFEDCRVAVAGDLMLDCYISGKVKRISPEAPVPVVRMTDEKFVLGGAGNAIANLSGLGVQIIPAGRLGSDMYAARFLGDPAMRDVDSSNIIMRGQTSVKTRILGGHQQMLRLDNEVYIETTENEAKQRASRLLADEPDCVVISDYGKGYCSEALCRRLSALCEKRFIPLLIDPKKADWSCYSGAYLITPNVKELEEASGREIKNEDSEIVNAARELIEKYDIENILVTRSEKGSTLVSDDFVKHIPASAVEVYDVSGAGDTTISTIAAFLAAGLELSECCELANLASQFVVGKVGTYPIKAEDLLGLLKEAGFSYMDKIAGREAAAKTCAEWKAAGRKLIFTNGCFDIIHSGHIDSLNKAKELGDRLIVGLNSDASVKRLKGESRPVNGEADRAKILAALEAVDLVVVFGEDTPHELLSVLHPNVIAKGGDYLPEQVAGREFADEVAIIPLTQGYSTTGIIEKIK